jgi:hypothetical protein
MCKTTQERRKNKLLRGYKMKKILLLLSMIVVLSVSSCKDADIVSHNLSEAADQFQIYRRVVFYNGITDTYMLSVEGFCSIRVDTSSDQLELTVKVDEGKYFKHFLGLSDNVTYFVEQLDGKNVSPNHYKVIFKPSVIVPEIEMK